ncbi:MAG: AAA family ATPase [Symploca sp. SIO2C1]|nr:AAA family ATPase [Symploca sp. SIO2C1]
MRLEAIFIRFYKSFNVDHQRQYLVREDKTAKSGKSKKEIKKQPWEVIKTEDGDLWFPFIKIPIDPQITAVVGANESGKSHLLTAIESAINGKYTGHDYQERQLSPKDFCRYSDRFIITGDACRIPDFVTEWSELSQDECDVITACSEIPQEKKFDRFYLFRKNVEQLIIYLPNVEEPHTVKSDYIEKFQQILPNIRILKNDVALPDSVPIQKLVEIITGEPKGTRYEYLSASQRRKIRSLLDDLLKNESILTSPPPPTINSPNHEKRNKLIDSVFKQLKNSYGDLDKGNKKKQDDSVKLAYDMICTIAKINTNVILELADAMTEDDIGYTQALIDKINRQLAANLNFPKYWLQDNKFQIVISAKDHNLEFSIIDRTETKYSFEERSSGLKYFLSYFIQHRAYKPSDNKPTILLMDEPDTYLSNQAQQDLLKIFEEVANPEDAKPNSQVLYVTHSPFLIDKNHSERIRVLSKGTGYEGTQVVKGAAHNRYEPLRSSLGAFVAETVYIGQCNLMVEGPVDQVILAGAATLLLKEGASQKIETLNLNEITIVPAGGTGNVPYMTYLACSRDEEQAAVIVLLDSDSDGAKAVSELTEKKYGLQQTQLLNKKYVIQIGDLKNLGVKFPAKLKDAQIEDLIPLRISVLAAQKYGRIICGMNERDIKDIKEDNIQTELDKGMTMFKAVNSCVESASKDKPHLSKLPFARTVIEVVKELQKKKKFDSKDVATEDIKALDKFNYNFKILFKELNDKIYEAEMERTKEKASEKVKHLEEGFFNNHPNSANKEDAVVFLTKLKLLLMGDDRFPTEAIKNKIESIERDYELDQNLTERIENYQEFTKDIKSLKFQGKKKSEEIAEED